MRLLQKTNQIYLGLAVVFFAMGGLIFYALIERVVSNKTDENLYTLQNNLQIFILKNDTFPVFFNTKDNWCYIKKVQNDKKAYAFIKDTLISNAPESNDQDLYRELVFTKILKGQNFEIRFRQSTVEKEDLILAIAKMTFLVVILLILVLFFVNRFVSKKIWQPFYNTLKQVKSVEINDPKPLNFMPTKINEFQELNETFNKMTVRLRQDYQNLKEFTDNASHELQTPLTAMQLKLENLFQDDSLTNKQSLVLNDLYQQTIRLSQLSQTLLLLSKIENQQYVNAQSIDLKIVIQQKLHQLEDLISSKKLTVETHYLGIPSLFIDPILADILVSNLIGNAIRHNIEGDKIEILLEIKALTIKNRSKKGISLDKNKIFQRFFKDNTESNSFGLGLALVKQIANNQKWKTDYHFENKWHIFKIIFL